MQGRRLGGWGARGDASPLRSGPIPSWQRVYHHPPGEERWGRRGSRGRRRRGGCRGQWEDSLYREGPTPAPRTWEPRPPRPQGVGERRNGSFTQGSPHSWPQPGTGRSPHKMHHLQSASQQPGKLGIIFALPTLQRRELRRGLVQLMAQRCSHTPIPSPGSCPHPRGWAHRGGARLRRD